MASPYREPRSPRQPRGPSSPNDSSDSRDRLLLDRVRAGDQDALQALVNEYWSPLVRYAARMTDSVDAAEDVVQEGFVRLWERRSEWQPMRSARVLLYTMVRNLALNRRRAAATHARLLTLYPHHGPRPQETPLESVEGVEVGRAIERAIDALPDRRREVLLLSRYHDLSRAEIAELLDLSPQTVSNHLTLGITELRQALQPFLAPPT